MMPDDDYRRKIEESARESQNSARMLGMVMLFSLICGAVTVCGLLVWRLGNDAPGLRPGLYMLIGGLGLCGLLLALVRRL